MLAFAYSRQRPFIVVAFNDFYLDALFAEPANQN